MQCTVASLYKHHRKWNSKCRMCVVMVCVGFRGGDLFQQAHQLAHFKRLSRAEQRVMQPLWSVLCVDSNREGRSHTLLMHYFLRVLLAVKGCGSTNCQTTPASSSSCLFHCHRSPCECAHYGCEHVKKLGRICKLFAWALEAEIQRCHHLLWMLREQVQSNM